MMNNSEEGLNKAAPHRDDVTLSQFEKLKPRDFEDGWGTLKPTFEGYLRDRFTSDGVRQEAIDIAQAAAWNLESLKRMDKYEREGRSIEFTLREMTELIDAMTRLRRILVEVGLNQKLLNLPQAADAVGMTKAGVSKWRDDPFVDFSWN